MGADLITLWVACDGDRWTKIDWDRAERFIREDLHEDDLVLAFTETFGFEPHDPDCPVEWPDPDGAAAAIRKKAIEGLELWKAAWDEGFRSSVIIVLKDDTHILLVGGMTWGDPPFEGFNLMQLALYTEALVEAGFDR